MAAALVDAYLNPDGEFADMDSFKPGDKVVPYRIVGNYKGSDLVGMKYLQLMPWIKPTEKLDELSADFVKNYALAHSEKVFFVGTERYVEMEDVAFRVIPGDYVTTDDGTGIVHIAPTFGADDAKVAKDAGVPSLFFINKAGETRPMVDLQGKYYVVEEAAENFSRLCMNVEAYSRHAGAYVKNAYDPQFNVDGKYDEKSASKAEDLNIVLCLEMKQEGSAYKIEKHIHNYPHCWRTDKPVLYYPLDSWFIRSTASKERMVELNKTINWKPESTGTGRFGNWLENLNDWNLSRSRFWGTPLPIWRNKHTGEEICIGSLEELYNEIEKSVDAGCMASNPLKEKGFVPGDFSQVNYDKIDVHRPYVDEIVLVGESGEPLHREADLIDVWFDSGSMPYAQVHYPFENKDAIDKGLAYPADFINEGVDQTRGWFFTLHAIATMIFDSVAFKNVISTGLVLDAKGIKMSKHLGNVVNPFSEIERNGADAVRFYMLTNSQPWDNLKFDPSGVDEMRRKFFGTLYNTYSFFALYANVDGFDPSAEYKELTFEEKPEIDRWILSKVNTLIKNVDEALADYEPTKAGRYIESFVNDDLSNWYVRLNRKRFWGKEMSTDKVSAYRTLYTCLMTVTKLLAPFAPFYSDQLYHDLGGQLDSVHLDMFPVCDETIVDTDLETRMEMAQKITSMVLALRRKVDIKVKQPLQCIMIPAVDNEQKQNIDSVSDLILNEVNVKELKFVEGSDVLVKKVKCNFRTMGKKFGKLMKAVAAAMAGVSQEDIATLENQGVLELDIEGQKLNVELADVEIINEDIPGWLVSNEGKLTVALEVSISDELRKEGLARELINRIQNLRKETNLEITDRITVTIAPNETMQQAVATYGDYVCNQVLADSIEFAENEGKEAKFDEFSMNISIKKV
jgi:isoleucyl-tRNA synthetase